VVARDKQANWTILVGEAETNVSEPAQIAKGNSTETVDLVLADSEMGGRISWVGFGLEAGVEGCERCLSKQTAVGSALVVVALENVEL
jgi:hypothetical protein